MGIFGWDFWLVFLEEGRGGGFRDRPGARLHDGCTDAFQEGGILFHVLLAPC